MGYMLLDPALEQEQSRNADQEDSYRGCDECVNARPIDGSQMTEQADPEMDPGMLPEARATTTLRRTVPLLR